MFLKNKKIRFLNCQKGALLLEVLIAVVILSVCLTLIVKSLMTCLRATVYSAGYTEAALLLDNKLSELFLKRSVAANFSEEGVFEDPFEGFSYLVNSLPASKEGLDGLNEVTVQVFWEMGSKERDLGVKIFLLDKEAAGGS